MVAYCGRKRRSPELSPTRNLRTLLICGAVITRGMCTRLCQSFHSLSISSGIHVYTTYRTTPRGPSALRRSMRALPGGGADGGGVQMAEHLDLPAVPGEVLVHV